MKELIHNTIIADSKLVQSGKIACQRFRLDVVQILYEPAYPIGNAPRDCRIQPCQITRRRVEDPDLVHRLFQPELSNNIIERLALLPSRDLLPLAHESLPDIATDCQALIGISEYPQQRPLYRRFQTEIEAGADFATSAMRNSTCPSRTRGGDLGTFRQGKMVPEFDNVVFTGELNKVLGPVKTQFGYHLIEVTNRW